MSNQWWRVSFLGLAACGQLLSAGGPKPPAKEPELPLRVHAGTIELGLFQKEEEPTIDGDPKPISRRLFFAFRGDSPGSGSGKLELVRDGQKVADCRAPTPSGVNDKGGTWMRGPVQDAKDRGEPAPAWGPLHYRAHGLDDGCVIEAAGKHVVRYLENAQVVEIPFTVVDVASTGGTSLGLSDADLYGHADLRRGEAAEFFWHRWDLEKQAEELSLWIWVPTDLSRATLPVDLAFYAGGKHVGTVTREVATGWDGLHHRLDNPVRVDAWPAGVGASQVTKAPWQVHVIRNGSYVTTCRFDGGKLPALAARVPCAPADDATVAEAVSKARTVKLRPEQQRALKEARALHRSEEVRRAFRQLEYAHASAQKQGAYASGAEQQLAEGVHGSRERAELKAQSERARKGSRGMMNATAILQKGYDRLVDQHGK